MKRSRKRTADPVIMSKEDEPLPTFPCPDDKWLDRGIKIIHLGFTYMYEKAIKDDKGEHITNYYACIKKRDHCKARLQINIQEKSATLTTEHFHDGNVCAVAKHDFEEDIKKLSRCFNMSPSAIYQKCLYNVPEGFEKYMISKLACKKRIHRIRRGMEPKSLDEITISKELKYYKRERFVKHCSTFAENEYIIILTTAENLYYLSKSEYWLGDGTFKRSPRLFAQIYSIHGQVNALLKA